MRVALDVGKWMKLAPLQADVLEWSFRAIEFWPRPLAPGFHKAD
jgi:hypothetical protein